MIKDFSRSQADASPETNQKSHCDEETSKAAVVEGRDLLSVAYKNAVDSRRAACRVITSTEQKEKSKSEEQPGLIRERVHLESGRSAPKDP